MSAKARAGMLVVGLAALAALAPTVRAAPPAGELRVAPAVRVAQAQGGEVSREQAVALVQQRFNARVLRVNVVDEGGRRLYVIQILSEGAKVSFVRVDASTGAISRD